MYLGLGENVHCDRIACDSGVCGVRGALSTAKGLMFFVSGSSVGHGGGGGSATGRMRWQFLLYVF